MFPENSVAQRPVQKIGKFKGSMMIVKESLQVLKQDKELAWFPVFSFIVSLVTLLIIGSLFFFLVMGGDINAFKDSSEKSMEIIGYITLFILYLFMFTIANYFLAGMYIIINSRFNNQNLSFGDGIRGANNLISKIFLWSLISATVGLVLNIISNKSKVAGKIVAAIFGAAWNILTYFSLPALIIGNVNVTDSFKESASTIRKTWGETIIINFGVGLILGLFMILGIFIWLGIVILIPVIETVVIASVLLLIYIVFLTIISSVLNSIFKLALYQYARTGNIPNGFSAELLQNAVKKP